MTTLANKIKQIYPSITDEDFLAFTGTILIENMGDGDKITKWDNPNLQPTQEQLDAIQ
jgi:hypothetical protein